MWRGAGERFVALLVRPVGSQRPCNWVRSPRLRAEQSPLPLSPAAAQMPQLAHLHQRRQCDGAHQPSQEGPEVSREPFGTQLALSMRPRAQSLQPRPRPAQRQGNGARRFRRRGPNYLTLPWHTLTLRQPVPLGCVPTTHDAVATLALTRSCLLFTLVIVRLPILVRSSVLGPLLKALLRCSALAAARHRPTVKDDL